MSYMNLRYVQKSKSLFPLLLLATLVFVSAADSRTVEEAINSLKGLSPQARQKKLEDGARSEGKAVYYGSILAEDAREMLEGFKRKYPFLEYGHLRLGNVRLVSKVSTETKTGRHEADVIQTSGLFGYQLIREGLLAKYRSPEAQNVREEFVDKSEYWTAIQHIPIVLGYNTKMVKPTDVPKSYEDVLNPKWRGRLVLDSDDQDVMAGLVDAWGEEKATKFFKGLGANQAALRRGRAMIGQLLGAGEFPMALFLHANIVISLKENGAPVDSVYLAPYITKLAPVSLAKNAPHPYAAILLYDYLLSRDLQKIIAEKLGREPIRKDVEGKHPQLMKDKYSVVNPGTEGSKIQQYQKFFTEVFGVH